MTDQIATMADTRAKNWALEREAAFAHLVKAIGFDDAVALSNDIGHSTLTEMLVKQRDALKSEGKISHDNPYPKDVLDLDALNMAAAVAKGENAKDTKSEGHPQLPYNKYTVAQNEELLLGYLGDTVNITPLASYKAKNPNTYEARLAAACNSLRDGKAKKNELEALGLSNYQMYTVSKALTKELDGSDITDGRAEMQLARANIANPVPSVSAGGGTEGKLQDHHGVGIV